MKRTLLLLYLVFGLSAFADGLPKAAKGFAWQDFPKECVALQVPDGWRWREKDNQPAKTVMISPKFDQNGGYDSGFTLNCVVCRNEKEWKDAYYSALEFLTKTSKDIKALGKPTFEKVYQSEDMSMQAFTIEGDMYLPNAPHPNEKYRVRTIVRAILGAGLVYIYSIGALVKDWDKIWKFGETMIEPIAFKMPEDAG